MTMTVKIYRLSLKVNKFRTSPPKKKKKKERTLRPERYFVDWTASIFGLYPGFQPLTGRDAKRGITLEEWIVARYYTTL